MVRFRKVFPLIFKPITEAFNCHSSSLLCFFLVQKVKDLPLLRKWQHEQHQTFLCENNEIASETKRRTASYDPSDHFGKVRNYFGDVASFTLSLATTHTKKLVGKEGKKYRMFCDVT